MTESTNPLVLEVERELPLSDAMLVPAAFREPMRRQTVPHRLSRRLALTLGIAMLLIAAAAAYGAYYWVIGRFLESTDDAYVQADSTIVASRVSGYVSAVLIQDDQPVKTGQILARIDDRDLRAALDQTRADVQAGQAEVGTVQAQLAEQSTLVVKTRASEPPISPETRRGLR